MSKDGRINFVLTNSEKEKLQSLAIQNNMTISKYMRDMVLPIILDKENNTNFNIDISDKSIIKRNKRIEIRFSDEEYNIIKEKAGNKSLSEYIRSVALKGNKTIKVDVYDDDIVNLENKLQPQIDKLFNVIKALKLQNVLHDTQYKKIEGLIQSIYDDLKYTAKSVRKNRTTLKAMQLKALDRRCKKAMQENIDSPAVFEMN